MKNKSPLKWPGGKTILANFILPHFPPHDCYVEVFGGSGALLFAKQPSRVEVFNELNEDVTNFFSVLRDQQLRTELIESLRYTPCSEVEYVRCKEPTDDIVERARRFFVGIRLGFNGKQRATWSFSRRQNTAMTFANVVDRLESTAQRLRHVQIMCGDFEQVIDRFDGRDTLLYVDPPYVPDTRATLNLYQHEMTVTDHERLLECLISAKGMVVLSGYRHALYDDALVGWTRISHVVYAHGAYSPGKKLPKREEILWLNPLAVERHGNIHDGLVDDDAA